MDITLAILPLRDVEGTLLQRLAQDLAPLGVRAELLPAADRPPSAYDRSRGQYRAEALLGAAAHAPGMQRVLGVTEADLHIESLNFVFGLYGITKPGAVADLSADLQTCVAPSENTSPGRSRETAVRGPSTSTRTSQSGRSRLTVRSMARARWRTMSMVW